MFGKLNRKRLMLVTCQLSTLHGAGLPLVRSLELVERQQKPGKLKRTLAAVTQDVTDGSSLSQALAQHPAVFDSLYLSMVRAGEAGGALATMLRRLTDLLEQNQQLKRRVIRAISAPAAVMLIALVVIGGLVLFAVPQFELIFSDIGADLPFPTVILINVSTILGHNWFVLPGLLTAMALLCHWLGSSPGGLLLLDRFKLRLPLIGKVLRESAISGVSRTLATQISAGVPLLEALKIARGAAGNAVIARAVEQVHDWVQAGASLSESFARTGAVDNIVVRMIEAGERTSQLERMLIRIANGSGRLADEGVNAMISLTQPMLILGVGGGVGFIVVALSMPLISLVEKL